jgi:hypothetical protein
MVETNEETHLPHCAQTGNMCGQIEYQIASGKWYVGKRFNAKKNEFQCLLAMQKSGTPLAALRGTPMKTRSKLSFTQIIEFGLIIRSASTAAQKTRLRLPRPFCKYPQCELFIMHPPLSAQRYQVESGSSANFISETN